MNNLKIPSLNNFFPDGLATRVAAMLLMAVSAVAQPIIVPGGSFESPTPPPGYPAFPLIDSWQKSPTPIWYDPAQFGGFSWDQLSGVFFNTDAGTANHINNMHGSQAAYLFAVPTLGIIQDYNTVDWQGGPPTHAFNATYEIGKSYDLTVGVLGGNGMGDNVALRLSLYYRNDANAIVPVGFTDVLYSTTTFPNINNFVDFSVNLGEVQAGDAWAGKNIGIQIEALSPGGSYWDIDNVRLVAAVPEPTSFALVGLGAMGLLFARKRSGATQK
jgi:hypothetical protein